MNTFNKNNLNNIKDIFSEKTGVELAASKSTRRSLYKIVLLTSVIVCMLVASAFAISHFSSLSGDELSFDAIYEGNGLVLIQVENMSDKNLRFQPKLKLMRWNTSEEVKPLSAEIYFTNTEISAHSKETMTIDLSAAYDVEKLEEPLTNDWYYLILTNNNFVFGQDWMCSVDFAQNIVTPVESVPSAKSDDAIIENINKDLQFYFGKISYDIEERRTMDAQYIEAYTELFAQFDGNIVPSASPLLLVGDPASGVILDKSVPADEQYLLVGEHRYTHDSKFKLLATEDENALVLSAYLPLKRYDDASAELPLFYIFTYEKSAVGSDEDYAFIYGNLLSFTELEQYKTYEDDQYVCYEVSELIYSDWEEYTESFVSSNPDIRYDEQVQDRVENIYNYYKENLGSLFYYK